ncbi:MAG TPA: dephospho-CoA kinase [Candidatus Nitrosotalea sp.]|nr:dephospho-CoA kinase [Candidatus Nitrosotalea sp.]
MDVVGLTGGIGSGKSTVGAILSGIGVQVIDLDQVARELQAPGSPVLAAIASAFGPAILTDAGELDRAALAGRVFGQPADLEHLNAIVHPAVEQRLDQLRAEAAAEGTDVLVVESPLLFESGRRDRYAAVILVQSSQPVRLQRLIKVRGMSPEAAQARIASQLPDPERLGRTPYVVLNEGSLEQLRQDTLKLWSDLRRRLDRSRGQRA